MKKQQHIKIDKLIERLKEKARRKLPPEEVDDLVQEVLLLLVEKLKTERIEAIQAYAEGILRHLIYDFYQKRREHSSLDGFDVELNEPSPEQKALWRNHLALIDNLAKENVVDEALVSKHFAKGVPLREVAFHLNVSQGAVNGRLFRFRQKVLQRVGNCFAALLLLIISSWNKLAHALSKKSILTSVTLTLFLVSSLFLLSSRTLKELPLSSPFAPSSLRAHPQNAPIHTAVKEQKPSSSRQIHRKARSLLLFAHQSPSAQRSFLPLAYPHSSSPSFAAPSKGESLTTVMRTAAPSTSPFQAGLNPTPTDITSAQPLPTSARKVPSRAQQFPHPTPSHPFISPFFPSQTTSKTFIAPRHRQLSSHTSSTHPQHRSSFRPTTPRAAKQPSSSHNPHKKTDRMNFPMPATPSPNPLDIDKAPNDTPRSWKKDLSPTKTPSKQHPAERKTGHSFCVVQDGQLYNCDDGKMADISGEPNSHFSCGSDKLCQQLIGQGPSLVFTKGGILLVVGEHRYRLSEDGGTHWKNPQDAPDPSFILKKASIILNQNGSLWRSTPTGWHELRTEHPEVYEVRVHVEKGQVTVEDGAGFKWGTTWKDSVTQMAEAKRKKETPINPTKKEVPSHAPDEKGDIPNMPNTPSEPPSKDPITANPLR